ncbi:MAG: GntR family transcriptional regulator [Hyphomicrobiaceae bacterium]
MARTQFPADTKRPTLAVQLVEQLRQMIFDGDLEPGSRLQEEELSQRFGVSRTPLREALKLLTAEGLITIEPNRGATVTELSVKELAETFPVMGVLEALAGELAASHANDDDLTALRALHDSIVAGYHGQDLKSYFAANQAFHERLVEAAHNETLATHYHQLAGRVRRARYRANLSPARWAQSVDEHEQIITALENHDGASLAVVLRAHIDHKFETVRDAIEREA